MEQAPSRRLEIPAIAGLLAFYTLVFRDVLFEKKTFFDRDVSRFYYPTKKILHDIVHGGEFPLWNPFYSAGQPMAANPEYEVFYPLQWLVLLPDFLLGFNLHVVIHFPLAAIGMFLFLRSRRLALPASLFGAVAYGSGGWMVSSTNLLPILFGMSWIPWILFFATRFERDRKPWDFVGGAVSVGAQALTGEPTTIMQTALLVVLIVSFDSPIQSAGRKRLLRSVLFASSIIGAGFLLASAQLLPAIDFVRDTVRAEPFPFDVVKQWSMPPLRPLEFLYPHLFGVASAVDDFWGYTIYPSRGYPFILNMYMGLATIAFAFAAVICRLRGWLLYLTISACAYFVAIGAHTPLLLLLYELGLFSSLRYPEKFFLIGIVSIVILSSTAIDSALSGRSRPVAIALAFTGAATIFAGAASLWTMSPGYESVFLELWRLPRGPLALRFAEVNAAKWAETLALDLLVVGLLLLLWRRPKPAVWALLIFLGFDLTRMTAQTAPTIEASYYARPPVTSDLDDRSDEYRLFHQADWQIGSKVARAYLDPRGLRYWSFRNGLFPRMPALWRYRTVLEKDFDLTNLQMTQRLVDAMWRVWERAGSEGIGKIMRMSNARYRIVLRHPAEGLDREITDVDPVAAIDQGPSPRFYFADRLVVGRSDDDFVRSVASDRWTERSAYVDRPLEIEGEGRVVAVGEGSSRIALDVEAFGDSLLVTAVTADRYWKAFIDGHEVPIVNVNLTYIGLRVPEGRHRIVMQYHNPVVVYSILLSLATLLVLISIPFVWGKGWMGRNRRD